MVVKECVNVTSPLRCDLTEALSDVEEIYYISVFAALGSQKSQETHYEAIKPILNSKRETYLYLKTYMNYKTCSMDNAYSSYCVDNPMFSVGESYF